MQKQEKKSPLKDRPLRYAGQSLDEQFNDILGEKIMPYMMIVIFFFLWIVAEWLRFVFKSPPQPITFTILFVGVTVFSFLKIRKELAIARSVSLGRDGERIIGQFLVKL